MRILLTNFTLLVASTCFHRHRFVWMWRPICRTDLSSVCVGSVPFVAIAARCVCWSPAFCTIAGSPRRCNSRRCNHQDYTWLPFEASYCTSTTYQQSASHRFIRHHSAITELTGCFSRRFGRVLASALSGYVLMAIISLKVKLLPIGFVIPVRGSADLGVPTMMVVTVGVSYKKASKFSARMMRAAFIYMSLHVSHD